MKNMNNTILPESSKNRLVTKDRERKLIVTPTKGDNFKECESRLSCG